jgi:hypothetical protein
MADAAYYRAWRRRNPEYVERERERSRSRSRTPEQRRAERERARLRAQRKRKKDAYDREWMRKKRASMSEHERSVEKAMKRFRMRLLLHTRAWRGEKREQSHQSRERRARRWLAEAHRIVGDIIKPDARALYHDPLYEDALGECLLLLLQHSRAHKAKREEVVLEAVREYVREERRHRWYAAHEIKDELLAG